MKEFKRALKIMAWSSVGIWFAMASFVGTLKMIETLKKIIESF